MNSCFWHNLFVPFWRIYFNLQYSVWLRKKIKDGHYFNVRSSFRGTDLSEKSYPLQKTTNNDVVLSIREEMKLLGRELAWQDVDPELIPGTWFVYYEAYATRKKNGDINYDDEIEFWYSISKDRIDESTKENK